MKCEEENGSVNAAGNTTGKGWEGHQLYKIRKGEEENFRGIAS